MTNIFSSLETEIRAIIMKVLEELGLHKPDPKPTPDAGGGQNPPPPPGGQGQ